MRVLIMGGGVVGVTTAYQLLNDGHEVVLLERHANAGDDTSWGNAGMIAPGHSFVWSSPKAPFILLKSLVLKNQALRFKPSTDWRLYTWSLKFLAECTEHRARVNTLKKHQLAVYSQQILQETLKHEQLDYDRMTRGILYFHRNQASLEAGVQHMKILQDDGQEIRVLDRKQVVELDPSLAGSGDKIAGGIYAPTDETGDCGKFSKALAAKCIERGAEFVYGARIDRIEARGDEIVAVNAGGRQYKADMYVMCLGTYSPLLSRQIGVDLPIYPIKGYSMTVPVGNHKGAPTVASVDENNLVAISRFGDRIRITATAEFAGYNDSHKPSDFAFMKSVAQDLYPDGGDYDRAHMWAGLRPMTPDNLPVFGRKKHRNLVYNTGHGHIGWTMSHGSARIIADYIAGRRPAIPADGVAA